MVWMTAWLVLGVFGRPDVPQCRAELEVVPRGVISSDDRASTAVAADIDGDGYVDLVYGAEGADKIGWYRWNSGLGAFDGQRVVSLGAREVIAVFAADLDGDGDIDLASASRADDTVAWYENTDGAGRFGPRQVVSADARSVAAVNGADLDGDGDIDLLAAYSSQIVWYENLNGLGSFGFPRGVSQTAMSSFSVIAADIDGDGDMDLAYASSGNNRIAWSSNSDGAGTFVSEEEVTLLAVGVVTVFAADMDGDGDVDLASASYGDNTIAWYENTLMAGSFWPQHVVSTGAVGAWSVFAADLDGDGDVDLASASQTGGTIAWYENSDGNGSFGPRLVVSASVSQARAVVAADFGSDGRMDLASVSQQDSKIAWYENTNGAGAFGAEQVLSPSARGARAVVAADINGDGDLDLAAALYSGNGIAWYENEGAGYYGPQQVVTTDANGAYSVFAADLDRDGDMDLASASENDNKIAWYENLYGNGTFGPQRVVSASAGGARSVFAADIDNDGDMDLASASVNDGKIAWYENTDGNGTFGSQQVVTTIAPGASSVFAADIDGDGDMDLASASVGDDKIAWYENLYGNGTFGPQRVVSTSAAGARSVFAADIDGDGDLDLASASREDDKIAWYENVDGAGSFGPQRVVSMSANGALSVFAADVDGDGDIDLASASEFNSKIAWNENVDGY